MPRLRRSSRQEPGWSRRRAGRGFTYLDEDGKRLPAPARARCEALVIPPAWTEVWICRYPNGHLQAVGRDDAGRLQYLYHPDWRTKRDDAKFVRVVQFGKALSKARERVVADLGTEGMTRERGCAAAVRLLDLGYFRIGNDVYADANQSYGLTTLQRRHVRRTKGGLEFSFVGKSGVEHEIAIDDPATVEALQEMRRRRGGERLLAYRDGRRWRDIGSDDVNDYIRAATGMEATAKDFRTWHATVLAAAALGDSGPAETRTQRKRAVSSAMKEVADYLGNTPTMARTSYVDPRIVDAYEEGRTIERAMARRYAGDDARQAGIERAVLRLLRES